MNIRDLRYLVAIADYGHFGQAAETCFVSQPALSMQIKKLEDTLGVQLIERTSKSAVLTEVGQLIAQQARDILYRVENIKESAKRAKDPYSGEIRLGVIPTLAPYLLPHIIPGLTVTYPNLTIYLVEEKTDDLTTQLRQGKLDAVLMGLPNSEECLMTLPLFEEEFTLAIPANHSLAKRKIVKLADLENKQLLLLEEGHCMRDMALELCYQAKAQESKGFQATSLETLRHMVAAKVGITLLPKLANHANDGICYLPFTNPKPSRIIGMTWRSSSAKIALFKNITVQIRRLLSTHKAVRVIHTAVLCSRH